jgi:hypothetical protein
MGSLCFGVGALMLTSGTLGGLVFVAIARPLGDWQFRAALGVILLVSAIAIGIGMCHIGIWLSKQAEK